MTTLTTAADGEERWIAETAEINEGADNQFSALILFQCFRVTWSGQDEVSGISHYQVRVSVNAGNWTDWLTETSRTEARFVGTVGDSYRFQVQATDKAGQTSSWVESGPVQVEAVTKYYTFGGQRVAMRRGDEVYYIHGDHLGSTSLTTDQNGDVVAETRYLPYGQERWTDGSSPTDFGFTSQRNEAGFGLYDYNARYYSPYLNRFISPDTIVPDPKSPQNFNRYSYGANNPIRYNDPSGHWPPPDDPWEPLRNMWESAPEVAPEVAKEMAVDAVESTVASAKFVGNAITPPAPDAIVFGFSGSADLGIPGGNFSVDMGMEDVINFNNGEHTVFGYHGSGVSKGASANLSAYGGLIWNLPENSDYLGSFESVNATAAAGHGGMATYFWAPTDEPGIGAFTSGNTKGFVIGYAPGAGGSVSYNQTGYFEIESYPQITPEENKILERKPQHKMYTQRN